MSTIFMKLARLAPIALTALTIGTFTGCEEKGPAEKAGASVDKGIDKVKDAVTPAGPVEKAGRAVDNATK